MYEKNGKLDRFRENLTPKERQRFYMNDSDILEDTIMALVTECIKLQKRVEALENSRG